MLKDNVLSIINNNSQTLNLEYSKIINSKVIYGSELKDSAFAIQLGLVQLIKRNYKDKLYLIIVYKSGNDYKKIVFDVTNISYLKYFYYDLQQKCSAKSFNKTIIDL